MAEHAIKSNMFQWEGMDRHGKKVKGEMSGTSDALIKATLRRQGISPLKVKKKPKPLFGAGKKKITTKDICVFSRQLATMMSSGVPLVQSFEIVGRGHENKSMQDLIMDIKGSVESGGTLAEALGKHPLQFNELFVIRPEMSKDEIARRIRAISFKGWQPYVEIEGYRFEYKPEK